MDDRKNVITSSPKDFFDKYLSEYGLYIGGDMKIWLNRAANYVIQIITYDSFSGRSANRFVTGSCLCDIKDCLGEKMIGELNTYLYGSAEDICFEFNDIDDGMMKNDLRPMRQRNPWILCGLNHTLLA